MMDCVHAIYCLYRDFVILKGLHGHLSERAITCGKHKSVYTVFISFS